MCAKPVEDSEYCLRKPKTKPTVCWEEAKRATVSYTNSSHKFIHYSFIMRIYIF